ncbi:hypothetical protein GC175_30725 [bacterium]|nr:hypothetical protein [bacterium]
MPSNRPHRLIIVYRLIMPLLLVLGLLPLFSVSSNTTPALRCRFENAQLPLAGRAQLQLVLTNVQGATVNDLSITVRHNDGGNRYIDPIPQPWFTEGDLLPVSLSESAEAASVILTVHPDTEENAPLTVNEGVLATTFIQAKNESGVVEFTLTVNSGVITDTNGTATTLVVSPANCFLAIGSAQLPTATPDAPVSSILSVAPTPTETATATDTVVAPATVEPAPTQTFTPTFTPTESPTEVPTATLMPTETFTPTPTPVPVVLSTPTPRGGSDAVQSPLATPVLVVPVGSAPSGESADIAATLTVEAQTTIIEFSEEIVLEPLPGTAGAVATTTPRPTQTPGLERLSPPQLDETETRPGEVETSTPQPMPVTPAESQIEEIALTPTPELVALNVDGDPQRTERLHVQVEQPPAGSVTQPRPLYQILSWVAFVGAVVLVFTSWWLRREP